jgi:hypothetical protein
MCTIAFIGRAAWRFSMRLAMAAAAADKTAPRRPVLNNAPSRSRPADTANDFPGSAAVAAYFSARGLAFAVALRAYILPGPGRARPRLVAGIQGLV